MQQYQHSNETSESKHSECFRTGNSKKYLMQLTSAAAITTNSEIG
jgi:hypothetical protein